MKFLLPLLICLCSSVVAMAVEPSEVPSYLQKNCVTVIASNQSGGGSSGSGCIVVRKFGDREIAFIWTAYHVIDNLREVKPVLSGGQDVKVVGYRDAEIVQELISGGTTVGETRLYCKVLATSLKNDVALLQIRQEGFYHGGVEFVLDKSVTPVATELYHCGSPAGKELGHNSVTTGILAANGRLFDGLTYDQTTVSALGGSSGGIVARKSDGKYVGMLTLGLRGADTFNYIVPARRIVQWCDENKLRWAVDPTAELPKYEDLAKIPVEDTLVRPESIGRREQSPTPARLRTMESVDKEELWSALLNF